MLFLFKIYFRNHDRYIFSAVVRASIYHIVKNKDLAGDMFLNDVKNKDVASSQNQFDVTGVTF